MKPAKCKVCGTEYVKRQMGQKVCGPECALSLVIKDKERKKALADRQDRAQDAKKRADMVRAPELKAKAQKAFNEFIRVRDAGKACISCGVPLGAEPNTFDAGHYRSVGSAPHMRFVEDNTHGQCKHCNKYLAGNYVAYRQGLINRIGLRSVELIEADNTLRKYTREGLIEIARHYREQARKLKEKPK